MKKVLKFYNSDQILIDEKACLQYNIHISVKPL